MTRKRPTTRRSSRAGLAPLELVLSLPLLLMVMALIVGIGAAATWKVRTHITARHAVWSVRWPRTGNLNPRPTEWPANATRAARDAPPIAALDLDALRQPVVRGALGGNINVNGDLFDPRPAVRDGHAQITRLPPLLPRLGEYELDVRHPLLDNRWQYRQMGLGSNSQRRLPLIYDLPDSGATEQQYLAAASALATSPQRPAWLVLDRDAELAAWYGGFTDFHPALGRFCSLDAEQVRNTQVRQLIFRIEGKPPPQPVAGVPERMTRRFLARYRAELDYLQLPTTPPNPVRIAELELKIEQLEAFLPRIPNR